MKQCGEHALDLINKLIIKLLSFILLPARPEQFSPEKIKRIVIYGTVGIGNMVLYSPFFKALRNHFPKAHIHLIIFTDKRGSEQVLQKSNLVDEISTWVVSELSNVQLYNVLPQVFQRMKKWKADLLISRYNTRHIGYNLVTVLSRAPYRIGHVFEDKWTSDYDYLFNYPVEIDKDEYERDMYLRLGESIGVRTQEKKLFFCMDGNDEQRAHEFLTMHGINTGKPFVTVQVGTSKFQKWKKWDTDKWIKLIKTLLENKVRVVVLGLADEWERLRNAFGDRDKEPIVAAGKMTLQQTAAIIKKSRLLVCNDSALMHIAAAVDTPTVAIFGPTSYFITAPLEETHTVIRRNVPCSPCYCLRGQVKAESCKHRICLESIEVEEVLDAVMDKLNNRKYRVHYPLNLSDLSTAYHIK